ncbi:MAG: indolepyruvate ferredoxin oxidoreductase family protein, partial [Betaproteobacteria bacterium]|nr:indolepyruvate ferredoxin oxidoreductase family protein [Betaproteobacteria bacterium]
HSVVQIAQSMLAEGAQRIDVVTDEPEKYDGVTLAKGVRVFHRDELDRIQREMREIKGTTVIIYDQTCATEKRRRRKRGTMVDPALRVLINEAVCEGCGDCGVQSNCLSVEPLDTEFGRKRTINQSTCNKDTSCLKGFCPSFVTVEGGQLKKKTTRKAVSAASLGALPEPALPALHHPWGMVVAGVGGTGVITIGQLLGMAAHIEGKGIVTQDAAGLAQKGGATWSHVIVAGTQSEILTTRVGMASADLIFGCDPIVSASKETLLRMREGRTHIALNSHSTPTAAFVKDTQWQNPAEQCMAEIVQHLGPAGVSSFNADLMAKQLMGDTIYVNPMILGYAWQKGWVPLSRQSLVRAIELNAVAVANNLQAFEWGRHAAHHPDTVMALLQTPQVIAFKKRPSLDDTLAVRVKFLTAYQNAAYAQRYRAFVERVRRVEAPLGKHTLSEAVAQSLFRLMAYKDEYEVARLHTQTGFMERVAEQFEGDFKVHVHLAPPLFAKRNHQGQLVKKKFGPAMFSAFKWLAALKVLRGTVFDVFGYTQERRSERALVGEYLDRIEALLPSLSADNHAKALDIARVPETIKGFGHVKARHLLAARQRWQQLQGQ